MVIATDIDKSEWPIGEWTSEPDVLEWIDGDTKLECLITRHPVMGHLCGYVGVRDDHPWFGDSYHEHDDIEVHGELTFSDYIPEKSSNIWWFGFDCGHGSTHGDLSPSPFTLLDPTALFLGFRHGGTYRNMDFVKDQVTKLAFQIKEASNEKE